MPNSLKRDQQILESEIRHQRRNEFRKAMAMISKCDNVTFASSPFPQRVRLVVSTECNNACGARNAERGWCHGEGFLGGESVRTGDEVLLAHAKLVLEQCDIRAAKIIGVETLPDDEVVSWVHRLKLLGFQDISITCGQPGRLTGILPQLSEAGMTRFSLTLSGTGQAVLDLAEKEIRFARSLGLDEIKANIVLRRSIAKGLREVIEWAGSIGVLLRLLQLMRGPWLHSRIEQERLHWTTVLEELCDGPNSVRISDYYISGRQKYRFKMGSGASVEVNLSRILLTEEDSLPTYCQDCGEKTSCEEGLWGCGVRIGPNGAFCPCILRPELLCQDPNGIFPLRA